MSLVELLALTTAVIVIVKTAILLKSQRFWYGNVTSRYWKGSGNLTMFLSFDALHPRQTVFLDIDNFRPR